MIAQLHEARMRDDARSRHKKSRGKHVGLSFCFSAVGCSMSMKYEMAEFVSGCEMLASHRAMGANAYSLHFRFLQIHAL